MLNKGWLTLSVAKPPRPTTGPRATEHGQAQPANRLIDPLPAAVGACTRAAASGLDLNVAPLDELAVTLRGNDHGALALAPRHREVSVDLSFP